MAKHRRFGDLAQSEGQAKQFKFGFRSPFSEKPDLSKDVLKVLSPHSLPSFTSHTLRAMAQEFGTGTKAGRLTWAHFAVHNADAERAFERLCKKLFSQMLKIVPSELVQYANQKGVEVEPIISDGHSQSFQSKYSPAEKVLWAQFDHSLSKTIEEVDTKAFTLDIVHNFTNGNGAKKNKSRDKQEAKARGKGFDIKWHYGTDILDLLEEQENLDLRLEFFGGGKNLKFADPRISTVSRSLSALKYQAQIANFVGREHEVKALLEFADDKKPFIWWSVEGDGSTGKSRLALEVCLLLTETGWNAGFLSHSQFASLERWLPECPHFLVVDYAHGKQELVEAAVGRILGLLDAEELCFPVRLLLIERDTGPIHKELQRTDTLGPRFKELQYTSKSLQLSQLTGTAVSEIVDAYGAHFGLSDTAKHQVATEFKKRPDSLLDLGLLCLFLSAPTDTAEVPQEKRKLVLELLARERKHWLSKTSTWEQEQYLVLATLVGGVNLLATHSPEVTSFLGKFDFPEYAEIVGEQTDEHLAALSHDFVNELYVLESLRAPTPQNRSKFDDILSLALQIDSGFSVLGFFTRAAADYPEHPTLALLHRQFSQAPKQALIWMTLQANIIDRTPVRNEEKLALFQRFRDALLRGQFLSSPNNRSLTDSEKELYYGIRDALFLRVLHSLTKNGALRRWVRRYQVDLETEAPEAKVQPKSASPGQPEGPSIGSDFATTLLAPEFCRAVVQSLESLSSELRIALACELSLQALFHHVLHLLEEKSWSISDTSSAIGMLREFPVNWTPGIAQVFREIAASLSVNGHVSQNRQDSFALLKALRSELEKRPVSDGLACFYTRLASVYATCDADYGARREVAEAFTSRFGEITSAPVSECFLELGISLSYGFRNHQDYAFARESLETSYALALKHPTEKNRDHLLMALTNFGRFAGANAAKDHATYSNETAVRFCDDFVATSRTISVALDLLNVDVRQARTVEEAVPPLDRLLSFLESLDGQDIDPIQLDETILGALRLSNQEELFVAVLGRVEALQFVTWDMANVASELFRLHNVAVGDSNSRLALLRIRDELLKSRVNTSISTRLLQQLG